MMRTWQISSVTDAARARIATARIAAAYGVPSLERTRLAVSLSGRLRQCLTKGGTWRLTLEADAAAPTGDGWTPWSRRRGRRAPPGSRRGGRR